MKNRDISISTSFNYELPIEEQLFHISEAGFSFVSLGEKEAHSGYGDVNARKRLKGLLDQYHLKIDTIHGPRLDHPDSLNKVMHACEAAEDLNVPVVVLHASCFEFEEGELAARLERLLEQCAELDALAGRFSVRFALENLFPGAPMELIKQAVLRADSPNIGFCYDSSHDQIGGPKSFDLLDDMKDRLFAVHISDRVREFVDHVIPWEGFIDWEGLCAVLRKTNFSSPLLLEVMTANSAAKETEAFLRLAYERACKLLRLLAE